MPIDVSGQTASCLKSSDVQPIFLSWWKIMPKQVRCLSVDIGSVRLQVVCRSALLWPTYMQHVFCFSGASRVRLAISRGKKPGEHFTVQPSDHVVIKACRVRVQLTAHAWDDARVDLAQRTTREDISGRTCGSFSSRRGGEWRFSGAFDLIGLMCCCSADVGDPADRAGMEHDSYRVAPAELGVHAQLAQGQRAGSGQ